MGGFPNNVEYFNKDIVPNLFNYINQGLTSKFNLDNIEK